MLFVLSPAKSFNFEVKSLKNTTFPLFLSKSENLLKILQKFKSDDIAKLMKISKNLSELNFNRFQDFEIPLNENNFKINAKAALSVFNGDVYSEIKDEDYDENDFEFAQNNLRILSGFYGILRPLDLIKAYRLEMGTSLKGDNFANLYDFWQQDLCNYLNEELKNRNQDILLNLASNEYSKAINPKLLNAKILNVTFKVKKGDSYKNIGIFAKKARGMMANYIIKNRIGKIADLKNFNQSGYKFNEQNSKELDYHFYN